MDIHLVCVLPLHMFLCGAKPPHSPIHCCSLVSDPGWVFSRFALMLLDTLKYLASPYRLQLFPSRDIFETSLLFLTSCMSHSSYLHTSVSPPTVSSIWRSVLLYAIFVLLLLYGTQFTDCWPGNTTARLFGFGLHVILRLCPHSISRLPDRNPANLYSSSTNAKWPHADWQMYLFACGLLLFPVVVC